MRAGRPLRSLYDSSPKRISSGSRKQIARQQPTTMWNSKTLWSFAICKLIILDIKRPYPPGTLKNWRKCLEFLADQIYMDATVMYNTMTPGEYLERFGIRDEYWARVLGQPTSHFRSWPWHTWSQARGDSNARKDTPYEFTNMLLPGISA